jgi:hypothetical protein
MPSKYDLFISYAHLGTALKLRRMERFRGLDHKSWGTLITGLGTDFDELGDAYITVNIYNEKMLHFYADTLKGCRVLPGGNKQAKANEVAEKEKLVRNSVRQHDQVRDQRGVRADRSGRNAGDSAVAAARPARPGKFH